MAARREGKWRGAHCESEEQLEEAGGAVMTGNRSGDVWRPTRRNKLRAALGRLLSHDPGTMMMKRTTLELLYTLVRRRDDGGHGI